MSAVGRTAPAVGPRSGAYALPEQPAGQHGARRGARRDPGGCSTCGAARDAGRDDRTGGASIASSTTLRRRRPRVARCTPRPRRSHGRAAPSRLSTRPSRSRASRACCASTWRPGTHVGSLAISLMQLATVESAIPNYVCAVGLDGAAAPAADADADDDGWARARHGQRAPRRWPTSRGDPAVIVGIVDSGIEPDHPEFGDRTARRLRHRAARQPASSRPASSCSATTAAPTPIPTDRFVGHGMGCAGIIGGAGRGMPPGLAGDCRRSCRCARSAAARLAGQATTPSALGAISDLDMGRSSWRSISAPRSST